MTKTLILVGVLVGAIIGVAVFINRTALSPQKLEQQVSASPLVYASPVTQTTNVSQYDFLEQKFQMMLEASISAVNKRIDDLAKKQTTVVNGVTPVVPVTNQVTVAPSSAPTGAQSIYIPIGYGGSSTAMTDFANVPGQEVTIDTNNYPGYKRAVLEVSFRIYQGNGTGYVRLGNKTDGTTVLSSDLSTTSQDFTVKTSSGFGLSSGSKTYVVQAKSTTGYSVDLQLARLRIDF